MKHYPSYEGTAREEIDVAIVKGRDNKPKIEILATDLFGDCTNIWLTPGEARALAEDLKLTAEESEA